MAGDAVGERGGGEEGQEPPPQSAPPGAPARLRGRRLQAGPSAGGRRGISGRRAGERPSRPWDGQNGAGRQEDHDESGRVSRAAQPMDGPREGGTRPRHRREKTPPRERNPDGANATAMDRRAATLGGGAGAARRRGCAGRPTRRRDPCAGTNSTTTGTRGVPRAEANGGESPRGRNRMMKHAATAPLDHVPVDHMRRWMEARVPTIRARGECRAGAATPPPSHRKPPPIGGFGARSPEPPAPPVPVIEAPPGRSPKRGWWRPRAPPFVRSGRRDRGEPTGRARQIRFQRPVPPNRTVRPRAATDQAASNGAEGGLADSRACGRGREQARRQLARRARSRGQIAAA